MNVTNSPAAPPSLEDATATTRAAAELHIWLEARLDALCILGAERERCVRLLREALSRVVRDGQRWSAAELAHFDRQSAAAAPAAAVLRRAMRQPRPRGGDSLDARACRARLPTGVSHVVGRR